MAKKETKLNEAAAAMGRKGGLARKKALSKKRRQEIAAMGGKATKGIPKRPKKPRQR